MVLVVPSNIHAIFGACAVLKHPFDCVARPIPFLTPRSLPDWLLLSRFVDGAKRALASK